MDWTIYWFMLPACIAIAGVAMFSGISGAAMLIPVFLIAFPLLGVPQLTTVEAVGTSLLLETSGFGTGLYRYFRLRLVDSAAAWRLIALTLPLGMLGALNSAHAPVQALRLGYGVAMVGLALLLVREAQPAETDAVVATATTGTPGLAGVPDCGAAPGAAFTPTLDTAHPPCPLGTARQVTAADGTTYVYCAHGLNGQQFPSGIGAFFAGLISTDVGEATLPGLVRRSHFPIAVAAATSTVVVAGTVVGAALTHMCPARGGWRLLGHPLEPHHLGRAWSGSRCGPGDRGSGQGEPACDRVVLQWTLPHRRGHIPAGLHSLQEPLRLSSAYSPAAPTWPGSCAGPDRL